MKRGGFVLVLWAIVSAAAWSTGRDLLFNLSYLLLAMLVLSFLWTWASIRWVRLSRQTRSRRTQVGEVAEERFVVHNTGILPKLWLEVRDHSELPGHQVSRVVNALGPRRKLGWSVRTICQRRGQFRLGPITLASGDPFGLFRHERELSATSNIIVYPATVSLPGFTPPAGQLPGGEATTHRTHYITTNVSGVRDYVPGDSFNRIHWLSAARHDRLISKEFELDPVSDLWIALDMEEGVQQGEPAETDPYELMPLWSKRAQLELDPTTEEYAVTVAASLAKHFLNQNRATGLVTYGQRRQRIQVDRGERQLAKILETLAVVRAEGRVPLDQVLTAESRSFGRYSTLIAITPSPFEDWVNALRDLRQRNVQVMAIYLEATTFGERQSSVEALGALSASDIPTFVVKKGDSIAEALNQQTGARLRERGSVPIGGGSNQT